MNLKIMGQNLDDSIELIGSNTIQYHQQIYQIPDEFDFLVIEFKDKKQDNKILSEFKDTMQKLDIDISIISLKDYLHMMDKIDDYDLKNRCHHYLYEKERMIQAQASLENHDYMTLGQLMNQSYDSNKNFYTQSTQKQDQLIIFSRKFGSIGANIDRNHLIVLVSKSKKQKIFYDINQHYKQIYNDNLRLI
ncbi:MAG: hypothetical protein AB7E09_02105 [Candidatus Izemoplasmatales bacterium]